MSFRQIKSKNKYNAKGRNYNGQWYHSTGEMNYAMELDWRKKAGEIKDWERQVKIDIRVNGMHITNYFIDFKIIHNDGSVEFLEYKGMETPLWQLKWNLLLALRDELIPGAELTVVKHNRYKRWK
jgi:hypothetical protein